MQTINSISNPIFGILLKPALVQILKSANADSDLLASDLAKALAKILVKKDAYKKTFIPKKSGGFREIQKPYDGLKTIQRFILHGLLARHYAPTPICHSFISGKFQNVAPGLEIWVPGRSIVSNAKAHIGLLPAGAGLRAAWRKPRALFSIDLKDAYPSISQERVFEIYQKIMGDPWTAQILTWLTTYEGCLPQGAPTSPVLFNLACRELDAALWEEFNREPYCVTRYADDITITSEEPKIPERAKERLVRITNQCGFVVNRDKDCYWRENQHTLRVTGINIFPAEQRLGLPKPVMEKFRAMVFHCSRILEGLAREKLRGLPAEEREIRQAVGRIRGIIGFAQMVYGGHLPKRLFNWNPAGWQGVKNTMLQPEIQGALKGACSGENPQTPKSAAEKAFVEYADFMQRRGPEQLWLSDEIFNDYFRDATDTVTDYSNVS